MVIHYYLIGLVEGNYTNNQITRFFKCVDIKLADIMQSSHNNGQFELLKKILVEYLPCGLCWR
jgi:hypothetical protein